MDQDLGTVLARVKPSKVTKANKVKTMTTKASNKTTTKVITPMTDTIINVFATDAPNV